MQVDASIPEKSSYKIPLYLQKNPPKLEKARFQYQQAYDALEKNQLSDQEIDALLSYPLHEYLLFEKTSSNFSKKNAQSVSRLLNQYPSSHLATHLRKKWLQYLKKHNRKFLFQVFYQDNMGVELTCYHFDLRLRQSGLTQSDFVKIRKLWLVGKSQPKGCDNIFSNLVKSKYLNKSHVWQRIEMAMNRGNTGLARFLKRFLPKSEQQYVTLWTRLRSHPTDLARTRVFKKFNQMERLIAVHTLKRLAWKRSDQAMSVFDRLQVQFKFNHQESQHIIQSIAASLVYQGDSHAAVYLDKVKYPIYISSLQQKLISHPLQNNQWQTVIQRIEQLPLKQQQSNQWSYWKARALEQLGNKTLAKAMYLKIASDRDYYSFLSALRIDKPIALNHNEPTIDTLTFESLKTYPGIIKARELLHHGDKLSARREWIKERNKMSVDQKIALAVIADSWGWHEQSIISFAQAKYWDDLNRRFPLPYQDIQQASKQFQIDPSWSYAIARQESAFMDDATSGSGARGLMQLMPKTASYIAKKYNIKPPKRKELYQADTNIQLGTGYLKYLLNKTQNNPIIATAAYNAGPNRVAHWLPEQSIPTDIWVESIPFKETRKYVKNVIAYQAIYASHMGREDKLINSILKQKIGKTSEEAKKR
jgi:soluble lytic murein transglycosylase